MDANENRNPPGNDHPLKKAAMAAIGAISGAVEKVADAIGEATTQENIDKMARKGEDVFRKVKDFGAGAAEKVKHAVDETKAQQRSEALGHARDALAEALEGLRTLAAQGKEAVSGAIDSESFKKFTDDLSRGLKAGKEEIERLVRRVRELEADEDAIPEEDDDADDIDETKVPEPKEGEIVYMSDRAPKNPDDKVAYEPADDDAASPTAPDDENNTNKLKSVDMNDHIPQSVPPEY